MTLQKGRGRGHHQHHHTDENPSTWKWWISEYKICRLNEGACKFLVPFSPVKCKSQHNLYLSFLADNHKIKVHMSVLFLATWTMKYSQKLQPGCVRFSRRVRMSSSKRPRFLVKDMRSRVRSLSSKEFQDSWDRDESLRGSDSTTHLRQRAIYTLYTQGSLNPHGFLYSLGIDYYFLSNCFKI